MQAALDALTTIGGVGGSVTVAQAGSVYTITFGGSLADQELPVFAVGASTVATATVQTGQRVRSGHLGSSP